MPKKQKREQLKCSVIPAAPLPSYEQLRRSGLNPAFRWAHQIFNRYLWTWALRVCVWDGTEERRVRRVCEERTSLRLWESPRKAHRSTCVWRALPQKLKMFIGQNPDSMKRRSREGMTDTVGHRCTGTQPVHLSPAYEIICWRSRDVQKEESAQGTSQEKEMLWKCLISVRSNLPVRKWITGLRVLYSLKTQGLNESGCQKQPVLFPTVSVRET